MRCRWAQTSEIMPQLSGRNIGTIEFRKLSATLNPETFFTNMSMNLTIRIMRRWRTSLTNLPRVIEIRDSTRDMSRCLIETQKVLILTKIQLLRDFEAMTVNLLSLFIHFLWFLLLSFPYSNYDETWKLHQENLKW